MDNDLITVWLKLAQSGDKQARENLLDHHRSMIRAEAQRICRRFLDWGRDDELSIALIAFNESIDAFRTGQGGSFWSFARLVMKRRLIDYFRTSSTQDLPAGEEPIMQAVFNQDWEQADREKEVELYKQLLKRFDITFSQLAETQPKHSKTRERLRNAAVILAGDQEMIRSLYAGGKLPKKKLCEKADVTSRMLDRGRAYVIALALLLSSDELPLMREYASELTGREDQKQ